MAGAAFCSAAVRRGFETKAFSHRNPVKVDGIAGHTRLDLNDLNGLERPLLDMWPDVIVNAAAGSEPDKVDQDPEAATRINVDFPSRLAEIANHLGARLIHLSSDLVFDGSQSPYRSTDLPNPLSSYGKQKLDAEKKVLKRCPENLVDRFPKASDLRFSRMSIGSPALATALLLPWSSFVKNPSSTDSSIGLEPIVSAAMKWASSFSIVLLCLRKS